MATNETINEGTADSAQATTDKAQHDDAVHLETPIRRGQQVIDRVRLRKPRAGELRGLSLAALSNLDVITLQKLIPRISEPSLTEHDVSNLDLPDLTAMGIKVGTFLMTKADRESLGS